jgi:pimeloyl-ACP methyl ester carboxylesterase
MIRTDFTALLRPRMALLLGLSLLLSACATSEPRPDLARLYSGASNNQSQPPVIIIHGLMGSTLVDAQSGAEVWPGSLRSLAFSDYRGLARMEAEEKEGRGLKPGDLFYGVGGVDFYSGLIDTLERIGRFHRGVPGEPIGSGDRRHYYVLLYDWRRDNVEAVRALHQLIDQIRIDYADPTLRVDIIAHSNGGLITNYYLRYGPNDVLDWESPAQWHEASTRIRRVVLLGTPNLGSVTSVKRLFQGFRIALRTVPVEVLTTFSTPFETLPHPLVRSIIDKHGQPVDIDIYDPESWRSRRWSVYSPEVIERVRASVDSPEQGDAAVQQLQQTFERNLLRARRFQWALTPPFTDPDVDIAVFGGDCELTSARALLEVDDEGKERLVFSRKQLPSADPGPDYDTLLFEPGDGLVTRASQVGRATLSSGREREPFNFFPIAQTFFLCERHGQLSVNPYFQNNLLYFLFAS